MLSARAAIILLGVACITAQTVLLRELLVQYHGNEFSVGVILGNWVAASALGAFLAGRRTWQGGPVHSFIRLTFLVSLLFPLSIALCRTFKPLAGIPHGMGLTLAQIFCSSLLLLLPTAALLGGQFVVATKLYARFSGDEERAPGRAYALDAAGTMAGGLLSTSLLVPLLSPLQVAALLLLLGGGCSLALSRGVGGETGVARVLPSLMLLAALMLCAGGAGWVERMTLALQWQGREVLASRNSPYQNITVLRDEGQLTVYTDGLPFTTFPDPDTASLEELAHLPALVHPDPRVVLLVGGSAGGIPPELLKHPSIERIDCLEIDPLLLETVTSFGRLTPAAGAGDGRVRLHLVDGRRFLRTGDGGYDLVLLNSPLPLSLQANRYFTREFFLLVRERLRPGGLLAFAAPGSTAYYSPDLKAITATLTATAAAVFPSVRVIPGESNLFLAFPEKGVELPGAPLLARRLQERGIRALLVTPEHLSWRLDRSQAEWFAGSMAGARGGPNRDFTPRLFSADLAQSTALLNPWLAPLLTAAARSGSAGLAGVALGVLALFSVAGRGRSSVAIPLLVASSGLAAMLLELILIMAFQVCSGVMFQAIALLIALFMGGLCCGSLVSAGRPAADYHRLMAGEAGLLVLAALLFALFSWEQGTPVSPLMATGVVMPLLFAAGFCTGMEFPPAVRLLQRDEDGRVGGGVGRVYAADLLGGWFGGVYGGMILPFLGFRWSCALLVSLKLAGMVLLKMQRKQGKL